MSDSSYTPEEILIEIAAEIISNNDLAQVIEKYANSKDPDEIAYRKLAILFKKVKPKVEVIESNWRTRLELEAKKSSENKNTNSGEFINKEPEAA